MFAASIFLAGLLAVGVPIAIHLLARQKTKVLPWGAMEFLRESINSASSRRNRLRDLLLLLLRALAILFLILTFAQPLASRLLFGGGKLETTFVWDISMSTMARDENGLPLQDAMKARLLEELDLLPDRSKVRILLAGAEARWLKNDILTLTSNNRRSLEKAIEEQKADFGGSQLANAILLAFSEAESEGEPRLRDVVVVHDAHQIAWQEEESNRWEVIRQKLAEDSELTLRALELDVAVAEFRPQVAVVHLKADRDTVAVGTPIRVRTTLLNESQELVRGGEVVWLIDGREVERSTGMEMAPGAEVKLEQVLRFDSAGSHVVECVFQIDDDLLLEDNRALTVVSAQESLPVLVVDDTQRTQRGQVLPSDFIVASLGRRPEKQGDKKKDEKGKKGPPSLFQPKVIPSSELNGASFGDQLAVLIANAESLSPDVIPDLKRFVAEGGGLWLMMDAKPGDLPEWMNQLLAGLGLEPLAETDPRIAENPENFYRLKASDPESRYAINSAAANLDLFRAEMAGLHALESPVVLPEEILLETPGGLPFLLSLPVGEGRVLLQTGSLGRENTNFPVLQSFVPFVRESTRECMAQALPVRNVEPGQPIRFSQTTLGNIADPIVIAPDESVRKVNFQGSGYEVVETLKPGLYSITEEGNEEDEFTGERFSVVRPVEESKLDWLEPSELNELFNAESPSSSEAREERRDGKWPLAILFAILTALFFLAEALLAHRMSRQRDKGEARLDLKPVF